VKEIKPKAATEPADVSETPRGVRLGQIKASKTKLDITVDRKASPEFASFVLERLPTLFDEYQSKQSDQRENAE
jgi:ParB family chromosome partitioning protein